MEAIDTNSIEHFTQWIKIRATETKSNYIVNALADFCLSMPTYLFLK